MYDRGDIFVGNTFANLRSYLCALFKAARPRYRRLVIPCCGKFAAAEAAIQAGWQPAQIECSDVSLFTTTLAAHINNEPLQINYGPITADGDLALLDLHDPPTVLFALKLAVCRNRAKNYYDQIIIRDLERRPAEHIATLKAGMDKLKAKLAGMSYRTRDLFDHLTESLADPEALVYCNPPGYSSGYEKMYDTGGTIHFPQPEYADFDARKGGYAQVRSMMASAPALGVRLMYDELHDEDERREALCADVQEKKDGTEYILTNRPDEVTASLRKLIFRPKNLDIQPLDAPIFGDDDIITKESTIAFPLVTKEQAMYYRDLFAHRLGAVDSERHYVLLIDGKVAGILGLHFAAIAHVRPQHNGECWLEENYGFTAPSYRYPRLNRLLMSAITCTDFPKLFSFNLTQPVGLITTCLCEHRSGVKTNRGILDEISHEQLPNGLWKLRYAAYWHPATFAEVINHWLAKHGTPDKAKFPT